MCEGGQTQEVTIRLPPQPFLNGRPKGESGRDERHVRRPAVGPCGQRRRSRGFPPPWYLPPPAAAAQQSARGLGEARTVRLNTVAVGSASATKTRGPTAAPGGRLLPAASDPRLNLTPLAALLLLPCACCEEPVRRRPIAEGRNGHPTRPCGWRASLRRSLPANQNEQQRNTDPALTRAPLDAEGGPRPARAAPTTTPHRLGIHSSTPGKQPLTRPCVDRYTIPSTTSRADHRHQPNQHSPGRHHAQPRQPARHHHNR